MTDEARFAVAGGPSEEKLKAESTAIAKAADHAGLLMELLMDEQSGIDLKDTTIQGLDGVEMSEDNLELKKGTERARG